ncbi:cation-dependent mannose-6-phosphate receptor-like [Schistocerca americana]|uniref:cation-dependent mannose-6-phosphate receptor-like n=1 Tax=Schistocerca americana TaxID=7009 RepID=UPI001F4FE9B6|nr:cation-dependent mannose-6-phosphate receptor-like [Schistocerca americana]XP_049945355.1 cation-dependent mannose-6-phosphate receptor-like [Schistocerca serialis cubense]
MLLRETAYFLALSACLSVFFVPCDSLKNKKRACKWENPCRCSFPSGLAIDFSELGFRNEWFMVAVETNVTLFFHPCSDLKLGPDYGAGNDCFCGTSVCLLNSTSNDYTNLGRANETSFVNEDGLYNPIYLQYKYGNRTTTFRILCDTESTDVNNTRLTVSPGSTQENHLKFELISAAACPTYRPAMSPADFAAGAAADGGLSTGSVLCILLFVFLGVYFVGGALALRLLRGATGREMVPNIEFWSALPELVKDGVTFTLNGCRVRPANLYDSI